MLKKIKGNFLVRIIFVLLITISISGCGIPFIDIDIPFIPGV